MENSPLAHNEQVVSVETRQTIEKILSISLSPESTIGEIFAETSNLVDEVLVTFNDSKNEKKEGNGIVEKKSQLINPLMKKVREVWKLLKEDIKNNSSTEA